MKVLVTVGTTSFNDLIQYIDQNIKELDIVFQIADGNYIPQNYKYFKFSTNIDSLIDTMDVIITHAGAGSIYGLLEKRKKIIVVPNLSRVDKHQVELATFIEENNYAFVLWDYNLLKGFLKNIMNKQFNVYSKEHFFKSNEIKKLINQCISDDE